MSKRHSAFQGRREEPAWDRDTPEDPPVKADAKTMSSRRILNPKTRRGRPGADLSTLGNPFAPVDPNVGSGTPSQNNANTFSSSVSFGSPQSQSFPPTNGVSSNQTNFQQNASFPPPSQNNTNNTSIFSGLSGSSTGFTFGSGSTNNPFAQASQAQQPAVSNQAPTIFGASSQPLQQSQPQQISGQAANTFGATSQSPQQVPTPTTNTFAQPPSTPFSGFHQHNSANSNPRPNRTSPNDSNMELSSPPHQQAGNQFSNLGSLAQPNFQSQKNSSPNLFANLGQIQSSQGEGQNQSPNLFGSQVAAAGRDTGSSQAVNGVLGGHSTSNESQASTVTTSSNLFGNASMPSSNPTSSGNLFGNLNPASTPKPGSFNATSSSLGNLNQDSPEPSSSSDSSANLFRTSNISTSQPTSGPNPTSFIGTGASKPNDSAPVHSQAPSDLFSGTPTFPKLGAVSQTPQPTAPSLFSPGFNPPATAPAKPSTSENNLFSQYKSSEADSQSESNKPVMGTALFGSQAPSAASSQPAPSFGAQSAASVSSAPSNSFATNVSQTPKPNARMSASLEKLNAHIRQAILALNPRGDWSVDLQGLTAAYISTRQRILFGSAASSTPVPTFHPRYGVKRKEQAEPPEEAPRPQKQPLPATANFSTPAKEQSNTSKLFQDIVEGSSKGPAPTGNLFGFNASTTPAPTPSLFQSATKPAEAPNDPLTSQSASQTERAKTLFGTSNTNSSNIFGHLQTQNSREQHEEERSDDEETLEEAMRKKPSNTTPGGSLFDRITPRSPPRDDSALGTVELTTTIQNGETAHEDGVEAALEASQGDHTWKRSDQIKFGESVNTPLKISGTGQASSNGGLFSQTKPQTENLFQSSLTPATPLGSPAKGTEGESVLNSGLKATAPTSNSLSVSNAGSNATSRATTPATEVNGISASEAGDSEDGGMHDSHEPEEDLSDRTALTAEEKRTEGVLFEVAKAKIMQFAKWANDDKAGWKTRGTGPLRVLKNKESGTVRVVHRIVPRGTILINSSLEKEVVIKKAQKGAVSFGAVGLNETNKQMVLQQWMARMASDDAANELVECLKSNKME